MHWANFLHIYQPPSQLPDIFERVVFESYRPIIRGLFKYKQARITLNINGVLTAKLAQNNKYKDVVRDLKKLANLRRIEFVASAQNHAFLPLLPESEIKRQILLNNKTNSHFLGRAYRPEGFFSPEMAYSNKVAKVAKELGYKWMLADELAFNGKEGAADFSQIYTIKGLDNFSLIFKERRTSNLIVEAIVRSGRSLEKEMKQQLKQDRYLLTAMDGETFGHHRPGLEELLYDIFARPEFKKVFISDIIKKFPSAGSIRPIDSTWSTFEKDLRKNLPYKLWWDPQNTLHKVQWGFTNFVIKEVYKLKGRQEYQKTRTRLDNALASCYYWWASKYWWSLEIVEQGAFEMRNVIFDIPGLSKKTKERADKFYREILNVAFDWQRNGVIRRFHKAQEDWQGQPFKKRTHAEWFNQMVLEFEAEMKKAASNQEYEQAIKWRDAVIKLKSGADVFDVLHVVNELWTVRKIPSVKPFLKQKKFSKFAKKYFIPLAKNAKKKKR
ncbi:MAG: UvrB/UvrC motif-containing protein [Patescibacteria group bacterium]